MNTFKNTYILLTTIVLIILLVNTCTKDPCGADGEIISSKVKLDSARTHHEHYTDSSIAWVHNSYSDVPEIPKPITIIKKVPMYVFNDDMMDLSDTSVFNSAIDTFYYGKKDSSLHYNIRVYSEVKPAKLEMEYDVKKLTLRDSVYVRDSINVNQTYKLRVNQLYYGGDVILYPGFRGVFVGLDFIHKKGWQAEIGAGVASFNADSDLMLKFGFKRLLSLRKKRKE